MNSPTPEDALVVRNILSFYIQILSQFVKPPRDTLLRYFNMFHLYNSYFVSFCPRQVITQVWFCYILVSYGFNKSFESAKISVIYAVKFKKRRFTR
jgi:hypothetical protein